MLIGVLMFVLTALSGAQSSVAVIAPSPAHCVKVAEMDLKRFGLRPPYKLDGFFVGDHVGINGRYSEGMIEAQYTRSCKLSQMDFFPDRDSLLLRAPISGIASLDVYPLHFGGRVVATSSLGRQSVRDFPYRMGVLLIDEGRGMHLVVSKKARIGGNGFLHNNVVMACGEWPVILALQTNQDNSKESLIWPACGPKKATRL